MTCWYDQDMTNLFSDYPKTTERSKYRLFHKSTARSSRSSLDCSLWASESYFPNFVFGRSVRILSGSSDMDTRRESMPFHGSRLPDWAISDLCSLTGPFQLYAQNQWQSWLSKNRVLTDQNFRYGCELLDASTPYRYRTLQLLRSSLNSIFDHLAIERSTPYFQFIKI